MIDLLLKKVIKSDDYANPSTRSKVGMMAGATGIIINFLLFIAKFTVGSIFGFVSVVADAINNLSDSGSSFISLIGSKLSNKSPDKEHPFGHERIEYIASLAITFIIIFLGGNLFYSSVQKIFSPEKTEFSIITIIVLVCSALVKLWLYFFNMKLSKKISSMVLKATALDSLSDTAATVAVMISLILSPILKIELDGFAGVLVAILIFKEAVNIIRETLNHLIGSPPSSEFCTKFEAYILSYDGIIGVHDLIIHNYGPNRLFASVHVEVPDKMSLIKAHDIVDEIERAVQKEFNMQVVIHMDPIAEHDEETERLYNICLRAVIEVDNRLSIHDFRVVKGSVKSKVLFDISRPYEINIPDKELRAKTMINISKFEPNVELITNIDYNYTQ